jgi:outer membrane protein assembly factor BamB
MFRFTLVSILLAFGYLGLVLPVSAQTSSDWYMAGANPERTSWVSEEVSGSLSVSWYRKIEAYIDQKTQVITSNGKLFIATSKGLVVLNATNGNLEWRFDTQLPLGHSPTVYSGVVYIGGFDSRLYALDVETGSELWSFNGARGGYLTNPLIIPDSNNQPVVYIGNRDGYFYAVGGQEHNQKGQQIWRYKTDGQINFSAVYLNNRIYFASDDNFAYALNTNGTLAWKTKLISDGFHSWWPVVYKNKIIYPTTFVYRDAATPGSGDALKTIGLNAQAYGNNQVAGTRLGPFSSPTTWSDGYHVLDASALTEAYERQDTDPVTDPYKHVYWIRPYIALDAATGNEVEGDSDGDGFGEGIPFAWWAKPGSTIYPPIVNLSNSLLYSGSNFECCSDTKGKVYGWSDDHWNYLTLVGSSIAGDGRPSGTGGWAAMAEPQAISGGGNRIYRSLCCDRIGDSFSSVAPTNTRTFWSYNLGTQIPGYNTLYHTAMGAISNHLAWYEGTYDFFPEEQKTWSINVSTSPRATYIFNPRRSDVFTDDQNSVTPSVTAIWGDINAPDHTEVISVTINKQAGCSSTPITTVINDPNPDDEYAITVTGVSGCLESNTINGQYGPHADQNPLVPYNGKVYTIRSGAVIAYGTDSGGEVLPMININNANTNYGSSAQDVQSRLEEEVQKIVSAPGFLRPGYTTSKLHNYSTYADYFANPGDTVYALSLAYPHLSQSLQGQVETYLTNYLREYFGTDPNYDNNMYARTGWAGLESRDLTQLPADMQNALQQRSKSTTAEPGMDWSYPPFNFYALYVYTKNVPNADVATIYNKAKGKITTNTGFDETTVFANDAFAHNAWISGLDGFLHLYDLAEANGVVMSQSDVNLRTQVEAKRNQLLDLKRQIFNKDSPWAIAANTYRKTMDLSRAFLYMSEDLAELYQNDPTLSSEAQLALDEYETIAPFWFVAKYEAMFGESGSQNLYQIPAIFQAKAWIQDLPREELIKYLDTPSFYRGDLFYIQNASIALEAPSDPNYTPPPSQPPSPTPSAILGDTDSDGDVDLVDYQTLLDEFNTTNCGGSCVADFDNDGSITIFDFNILVTHFGQ